MSFSVIHRTQSTINDEEIRRLLFSLSHNNLTFDEKLFEYKSPNDCIIFKTGDFGNITCGIKVYVDNTSHKISKIYYSSEDEIINLFHFFRKTLTDFYKDTLSNNKEFGIYWDSSILTDRIRSLAKMTNILPDKGNVYFLKNLKEENMPLAGFTKDSSLFQNSHSFFT